MPNIIHESQKGFMKGRYIGENIRLLYDTISITDHENIPGLLLMVDFEKAFDSVAWSFIEKSLYFFDFPKGLVDWFKVLYNKPSACVSFNGQYSNWFNLQRGCRQGDPISPYLYLICAEILSLMIRSNKNIKGIKIKEKETLISLFADDTTLYLDGSEQSFNEAIKTLERFSTISGLKMNQDKTQIAWIGSKKNSKVKYMKDKSFVWDPGTFKVLGILFSTSQDISKINYIDKMEEIKRDIARWKKRHMTPLGKITIIKTLIISKLTYLFINIPDPPHTFLKELDQILFRFLWDGKTNRIKKSTMCKPYEEGGLKMVDIFAFLSSLKIGWLRRLTEAKLTSPAWYDLYPALQHLEMFGLDYAEVCSKKIKNQFWLDVIRHYKKLYLTNHLNYVTAEDIKEEPIHYNECIKRDNNSIYIEEWVSKGILRIRDLLDHDGQLLNYNSFKEKYDVVHTNFLVYAGVVRTIKKFIEKSSKDENKLKRLTNRETWSCIRAGNSFVKTKLLEDKILPTAALKWNTEFQNLNWNFIFSKCFKISRDPQLQWFQSRLLHRILPTQKHLNLCRLADDALCIFCNQEIETINHLFWDCVYVQDFWKHLLKHIKEKCPHSDRLLFSKELILFGVAQNSITDKPLDFIVLFANFFIYKCKMQRRKPTLKSFIKQLQYRQTIEKYLAVKTNKETEFFTNWIMYRNVFDYTE